MMTTQEFNFLLAIAEFGWSRAEYHWYYLWLYDPDANDGGGSNSRPTITGKLGNKKSGKEWKNLSL